MKDILERRLQSVVFRRGLARSMKQARQFITHRHVMINHQEITAPSYLVSLEEENQLEFKDNSALASEDHPERVSVIKEIAAEKEAISGKNVEKVEVKTKKAKPVDDELVEDIDEMPFEELEE